MDTISAFAMGMANMDNPKKVFDWEKAARLIKETGSKMAQAGLSEDWMWTGATILEDGSPVQDKHGPYLASTWATPILIMDDGDEIPCYIMEYKTTWGAKTNWPNSAIKILKGEKS